MVKDDTCQDHSVWPPPAALDPFNYTDKDLGYSSLRVHTAEEQWELLKQMARTEGGQTHPGLGSDHPSKSIETTGMQSTIGLDDTEFHKHGTEDMDPCSSHSTNGKIDEIEKVAVLALHGLLLSEDSSDEMHTDNDGILEPTTPEADPVGELAMPEGLLHKAGWTFVSTCH